MIDLQREIAERQQQHECDVMVRELVKPQQNALQTLHALYWLPLQVHMSQIAAMKRQLEKMKQRNLAMEEQLETKVKTYREKVGKATLIHEN